MRILNFGTFREGKYDDDGVRDQHVLYILKNKENKTLYIGITERGIWYRWFGGTRGHMFRNAGGYWRGVTTVGHEIIINEPESLQWIIEMWTLDDCFTFLESRGLLEPYPYYVRSNIDIQTLEPLMIQFFHPSFNMTYNY